MTTNMLLRARRHGSMSSLWPSTLQNELFEQFTSQNPQGKGWSRFHAALINSTTTDNIVHGVLDVSGMYY